MIIYIFKKCHFQLHLLQNNSEGSIKNIGRAEIVYWMPSSRLFEISHQGFSIIEKVGYMSWRYKPNLNRSLSWVILYGRGHHCSTFCRELRKALTNFRKWLHFWNECVKRTGWRYFITGDSYYTKIEWFRLYFSSFICLAQTMSS